MLSACLRADAADALFLLTCCFRHMLRYLPRYADDAVPAPLTLLLRFCYFLDAVDISHIHGAPSDDYYARHAAYIDGICRRSLRPDGLPFSSGRGLTFVDSAALRVFLVTFILSASMLFRRSRPFMRCCRYHHRLFAIRRLLLIGCNIRQRFIADATRLL